MAKSAASMCFIVANREQEAPSCETICDRVRTNEPPASRGIRGRGSGWLADDHARIGAFLAATGMTPADLRNAAGEAGFLLAVIDFLMADEALLLDCCARSTSRPRPPAAARAALPGGEEVHWT
jgi:hypothetical protein